MLDKVSWKVFEKTGDIDAYLLYIDIKNLNNIKDIDFDSNGSISVANGN